MGKTPFSIDGALRLARHEVEAEIERLIALLDAFDGDADREPDEDAEPDDPPEDDGTAEPWLGWTEMERRYGRYVPSIETDLEEELF